jgi:hypothetical protein
LCMFANGPLQNVPVFCKWAPSKRTCFLQMGPFKMDVFLGYVRVFIYVSSCSKTRSSHGYLLQTQQSTPIAESIASPPLLCQAGLFYYRFASSHPMVILTGPCADAPRTKGWVLPGTIQEMISLRMGSSWFGGWCCVFAIKS